MTTLKLNQVLLDENDKPQVDKDAALGQDVPVTLRLALRRALSSDMDKDGNPIRNGEQKLVRYDLWSKVKKAVSADEELVDGKEPTDFTPEELTMLREAVLVFPTVVCGQLRAMLK